MRNSRKLGIVGMVVAGVAVFGGTQAQADDWEAVSSGNVGSADVTLYGEPVEIEPLAPCDSEGEVAAESEFTEIDGLLQFAAGSSTCSRDETNGVATSRVLGGRFRLDALRQYGGPRIRLSSYSATCTTTATGAGSTIQISGLTGVAIPSTIKPNHKVTIPGRRPHAKPLAVIVFNEKIVPSPPDGSLTANVMRIKLFPRSPASQLRGDIVVGSVSCAPF
jgi:hypothetical protein